MAIKDRIRIPAEGITAPCWCGHKRAFFSTIGLEDGCARTGYLNCFCGGDFCVCHNHGAVECPGCDDCEPEDGEDWWVGDDEP